MNRREILGYTFARRICAAMLFQTILAELSRAIADGAKGRAFHAWSLMENFEWTDIQPALQLDLCRFTRSKANSEGLGLVVRASSSNKSADNLSRSVTLRTDTLSRSFTAARSASLRRPARIEVD